MAADASLTSELDNASLVVWDNYAGRRTLAVRITPRSRGRRWRVSLPDGRELYLDNGDLAELIGPGRILAVVPRARS